MVGSAERSPHAADSKAARAPASPGTDARSGDIGGRSVATIERAVRLNTFGFFKLKYWISHVYSFLAAFFATCLSMRNCPNLACLQ